jgi:sugar O-acyltransferase (sialic acid O-acetyltransferase NeuD family)
VNGSTKMNHVYIVGAGGLGREYLSFIKTDVAYGKDWVIVGFIDSRKEKKGTEIDGLPVVGNENEVTISENTRFTVAVGDTSVKKKIVSNLLKRKAQFISTRTICDIGNRASVGIATLMKNVSISVDCKIGDYVFLDAGVMLGHDVDVGNFSHIGSGAFVGGGAKIGMGVTIHPRALIARGISIGDGAIIGLGAVVLRNVAANQTVIGNPGRSI